MESGSKPQQILRRYGIFFFSSRRRHTRLQGDWSSDVCSSDLKIVVVEDDEQVLLEVARVVEPFIREAARERAVADDRDDPVALPREVARGGHAEIGRASCRERV